MFFLRKSNLARLPVVMSGVKMGERALQIGIDDPSLAGAIAAKVGLSGHAAIAVSNDRAAAKARAAAATAGVLLMFRSHRSTRCRSPATPSMRPCCMPPWMDFPRSRTPPVWRCCETATACCARGDASSSSKEARVEESWRGCAPTSAAAPRRRRGRTCRSRLPCRQADCRARRLPVHGGD